MSTKCLSNVRWLSSVNPRILTWLESGTKQPATSTDCNDGRFRWGCQVPRRTASDLSRFKARPFRLKQTWRADSPSSSWWIEVEKELRNMAIYRAECHQRIVPVWGQKRRLYVREKKYREKKAEVRGQNLVVRQKCRWRCVTYCGLCERTDFGQTSMIENKTKLGRQYRKNFPVC